MGSESSLTTTAESVLGMILSGSTEAVAIVVLCVFLGIYTLVKGRGKMLSFLLALYPAALLYPFLPYRNLETTVGGISLAQPSAQVGIFIVVVLISGILLRSSVRASSVKGHGKAYLEAILLAMLGAALLITLAFHVSPLANVYTPSPLIHVLFVSSGVPFSWLALPLLVIFLLQEKRGD
jgi:hypothetical protein